MTQTPLETLLAGALEARLADSDAAVVLAEAIATAVESWAPPTIPAARIDRIVAYAFGNRPRAADAPLTGDPLADQLAEPGPVNAALADAAAALHRLRPVPIYAQWEVARFLIADHGLADVTSVEPVLDGAGRLVYLTTQDVARAAVAAEPGGAAAMGVVAVIAHRDHAGRCVEVSRAAGMDAHVVAEVPLPGGYDSMSGQTWTRRRDLYLLHDLAAQLMGRRARALAEAYPDG